MVPRSRFGAPSVEEFTERITRIDVGEAATCDLDPIAEAAARLNVRALDKIENLARDAANCLHRLRVSHQAGQWRNGDWRTRALGDALARRDTRQ